MSDGTHISAIETLDNPAHWYCCGRTPENYRTPGIGLPDLHATGIEHGMPSPSSTAPVSVSFSPAAPNRVRSAQDQIFEQMPCFRRETRHANVAQIGPEGLIDLRPESRENLRHVEIVADQR